MLWASDAFDKATTKPSYLVLHNDSAYHAVPTYLNIANNLLLQNMKSGASINVTIIPLDMTDKENANNDQIKGLVLCFFLIIAFSIIPSTFVYPIVAEVNNKAKHQQMISGADSTAYWY